MAGRILIVDDAATNRDAWQAMLVAACYQPQVVEGARACQLALRDSRPDLILLSLDLHDLSGASLLRLLRADARTRALPIIAMTARPGADARMAALQGGADEVLASDVNESVLLARIRNLLRSQVAISELGQRGETLRELGLAEPGAEFTHPGTIALVTPDTGTARQRQEALAPHLADRLLLLSRADTLADPQPGQPTADIFIIDADLGGPGGGLRLMSELRSRPNTRHASIVLLQTRPDGIEQANAFDMGAHEVLPATLTAAELALRLRGQMRRKQSADQVRASVHDGLRMAVIDPLTGLYNRRYALPRLAAIAERALTLGAPFAVMIVDLDRFKAINDAHGHAGGDAVLVETAQRLSDSLRGSDLLARIGGEEFLLALPDCAAAEARSTAERLRRLIEGRPVQLPDGAQVSVTVSIGLTVADRQEDQAEGVAIVVERADRALMAAKAQGRNRVILGATAA